MAKCTRYTALTISEVETMRRVLPDLITFYKTRGCVTEAEFDELGVINVNPADGRFPKHERVLHQQRAAVMNHAQCVAAYQKRKDDAVAAVETTAQNKAIRVVNKLQKEEEKQKKDQERAAKKAEKETERVNKILATNRAQQAKPALRDAKAVEKEAATAAKARARELKAVGGHQWKNKFLIVQP